MSIKDDPTGPVPEWLLERLAAGDLPPARARAIEARLAREPDGQARLAALAASNQEILAAHPPEAIAEAVRRRADQAARRHEARRRPAWLVALPAAAALGAAAVLLVVRAGVGPQPPTFEDDGRPKGDPSLSVYRKAGRRVEKLDNGAAARAGDELQLAYIARGKRFGAVLSIDGTGRVTFHLPERGGQAAPLQAGGEITLPQSYQLDAAPQFERFLLVAGNEPFDVDGLADVIRGTRPAPANTVAVTFTVRKE
jgi:hypothetical protein